MSPAPANAASGGRPPKSAGARIEEGIAFVFAVVMMAFLVITVLAVCGAMAAVALGGLRAFVDPMIPDPRTLPWVLWAGTLVILGGVWAFRLDTREAQEKRWIEEAVACALRKSVAEPGQEIRTRALRLVDDTGAVRLEFTLENGQPRLTLFDAQGRSRARTRSR